jgi:dipeptidyl aminopeptidase/acylaminoacyl peptidase
MGGTNGSISLGPEAKTMAFVHHTANRPAEVHLWEEGKPSHHALTSHNEALTEKLDLPAAEGFEFSGAGGDKVHGWLIRPPGFDPKKKYPVAFLIHGGPQGAWHDEWHGRWNYPMFAAPGYAVIAINPRGSTGYGQKFTDAILKDQNGHEARDVLAALDTALARYQWLDAGRLGVEGGSYGGQLANWLVTQTDRFKAAIPTAGISNLVSFNYTAFYHDYLAVEFGAYPHEANTMDVLWERSPLRYVSRVKTPVLILHGENDNDVPVSEAEQWYVALKDVGVETVMVRYPREGHGLREPRHMVDAIDRSLAWYEKCFAPPKPDPVRPAPAKKK